LSGLPNASIPTQNVYGDLPNDQTDAGGKAQLDVEYIMVRNNLTLCLKRLSDCIGMLL